MANLIGIIIETLLIRLRNPFLIILLTSIFGYIISLSVPLSFMAIIDRVLVSQGYSTLNIILIILIIVAILDGGMSLLSSKVGAWLSCVHISEVSHYFFGKIFSLKKSEIDNTNVGEVLRDPLIIYPVLSSE